MILSIDSDGIIRKRTPFELVNKKLQNVEYRKENPIRRLNLGYYFKNGYVFTLRQAISNEGKIYGIGDFCLTRTPANSSKLQREHNAKNLILLNDYFLNSELHHLTKKYGIYIPKKLHRGIFHNLKTGKNMKKINDIALKFGDLNINKNKEANYFR